MTVEACHHHPDQPCRPWCGWITEAVRLKKALGAEVAIPVISTDALGLYADRHSEDMGPADERGANDAPGWYSADEASAWAAGWNAASRSYAGREAARGRKG